MLTQRKELNFEGQNIYIGIDVHLKSWTVSIFTETIQHKRFTQPPSVETLVNYLQKNFPGANYYSAYEAGFCGFWIHYKLTSMGINNIVVNPADVPTTQKEQVYKDDPVDSRKISRSLQSGMLECIHIPTPETLQDRSLVRTRHMLIRDLVRIKLRLKSFLYFYGVNYPEPFSNPAKHWSNSFMRWLKEDVILEYESGKMSLNLLILEAEEKRKKLLEITRSIRKLFQSEKYKSQMELLLSIPGIGFISAIILLTEFENVERFKNTDHLAGYVGLIPMSHSSGEKENKGELSFRGKKILKSTLIESAWIASRKDPALCLSYNTYVKKMEANKAIVRIARKLLNRIYFVLKNQKKYVFCTVR